MQQNKTHLVELSIKCFLNTTDSKEQVEKYTPEQMSAAFTQGVIRSDEIKVTNSWDDLSSVPDTIRQHFSGSSQPYSVGSGSGSSGSQEQQHRKSA